MSLLINQNEEEQEDRPEIEPTPALTLTGLYGSGKSTLFSSIIEAYDGEVVFVGSETADVGMDGRSIPVDDENKVELKNVCMACNEGGEINEAINGVLDTIDDADLVLVEGPGNAGTRDMAGTVSNIPVLDQKYVGRMSNLENWEGEKSELGGADVKAANFMAVNRPTSEHGIETVEAYLESKGADTQVFETTLEDPLIYEVLEEEVEGWSTDMLAKSMGPAHLMMDIPGDEEQGHSHKDTEFERIGAEEGLEEINEVLLEIDEEDYEGLRIKANIGDYFVNIVNGEISVEQYEEAAPGYFIASNFGEIPEDVKEAFSQLDALTGSSISTGASKESVKKNLENKLDNIEEFGGLEDVSSLPDAHSAALKTSGEASEIWNDEEIRQLERQTATKYAETTMELIYHNRDDPQALAELATELHWTAEKSSMDTGTGREIAYEWLAEGLSEMSQEQYEEIASYSDGEEFFEYFSVMMNEAVEEEAITEEVYGEIISNVADTLEQEGDEELVEHYRGVEA